MLQSFENVCCIAAYHIFKLLVFSCLLIIKRLVKCNKLVYNRSCIYFRAFTFINRIITKNFLCKALIKTVKNALHPHKQVFTFIVIQFPV